jgi:tetratricopeptide (TPR) repeat protein
MFCPVAPQNQPDSEETEDLPATAALEATLRPELDDALLSLDQLVQDDPEEALRMFDSLPVPVQALPEFQLVLARAHQANGQLEAARDLLLGVLAKGEENADAHHLLADVLEDLGDSDRANEHFLRTLALDRKALSEIDEAQRIPESELQKLLKATLKTFAEEHDVALAVRDLPSEQDVRDGMDPRVLFDCSRAITLYSGNIFAEFGDLLEMGTFEVHVQAALCQEVIQAFSVPEKDRKRLGLDIEFPEDSWDED